MEEAVFLKELALLCDRTVVLVEVEVEHLVEWTESVSAIGPGLGFCSCNK